jgi:hypothetical protein
MQGIQVEHKLYEIDAWPCGLDAQVSDKNTPDKCRKNTSGAQVSVGKTHWILKCRKKNTSDAQVIVGNTHWMLM